MFNVLQDVLIEASFISKLLQLHNRDSVSTDCCILNSLFMTPVCIIIECESSPSISYNVIMKIAPQTTMYFILVPFLQTASSI